MISNRLLKTGLTVLCTVAAASSYGQQSVKFAFRDTSLPIDDRVEHLVSLMTLEQKVSQLLYNSPAIPELGIPAYNWWNESLHGVARAGEATVFPQAIGMAAAFDEALMYRIGTAISDEARAKYHDFIRRDKHGIYQGLTFWTPNINIFRDPRWGRGQETYGEDPYLTGRLAVNFIKGMQGDDPKYLKTVATAKHFAVHSGPEPLRHSFNALASQKDLWETYLPAFEMSVRDGGVYSVMCAYNRLYGEACCGSNLLLQQVLRDKWDFRGYVVSDCWAIRDFWSGHGVSPDKAEGAALALRRGTDLNCGDSYPALVQAVEAGLIDEAAVDTAVKRLFKARFLLGMFDPDEEVSFAGMPMSVVDSEEHRALALEAAHKSIVLLKNDKGLLPLKKSIKKVAVIGPVADDEETLWGNYCGYNKNGVTVLQGIIDKLPGAQVTYEVGCELSENFPQLTVIPAEYLYTDRSKTQRGMRAEYFDNARLEGEPAQRTIDPRIDFIWWDKAPHGLDPDHFSVRWEGYVEAPESGRFAIGGEGYYGYKMWVGDSLAFNYSSTHHPRKQFKAFELKKGEMVKIKIEYTHQRVNHALMRLYWAQPVTDAVEQRALAAAREADVVILCMGFNQNMEGEEMEVAVDGFAGGDRTDVVLPRSQQRLMRKIKESGKDVVLVLLNGSPVSCTWENDNFDAIVEGWYGGQATGTAVADVLFGDCNPSGRLPVTVYRSLDQLPPFEDYSMFGRTYRYFAGEPLYEFGYGLSYTKYTYSKLRIPVTLPTAGTFTVRVDVTNSGKMAGEEVVQLYVTNKNTSETVPIRSLTGFRRVALAPGETRTVAFEIDADRLAYVNDAGERVVSAGKIVISAGGRQPGPEALSSKAAVSTEAVIRGATRKF